MVVVPVSPEDDADLRYGDWETSRRLAVEEKGKGEIGYVHLRAMGGEDYTSWARDFYPVFDRQGLIIDVRNNRGGNIESWILAKLLRKAWFWWQPRQRRALLEHAVRLPRPPGGAGQRVHRLGRRGFRGRGPAAGASAR